MKRKHETDSKQLAKKQKLTPSQVSMQKKHEFQYIPSAHDTKYQSYIEIKNVNLLGETGYGLFARKNIPAEAILGEYTGEILKEAPENGSYCMDCKKKGGFKFIDALDKGNSMRFGNHASHRFSAHFVYEKKSQVILVETTKAIPMGAQILFNYGKTQDGDFLFLNPGDNERSTRDIWNENRKNYASCKAILLHNMGLPGQANEEQLIYIPKPYFFLVNDDVPPKFDTLFNSCKDLPLLSSQGDSVASFNEFDSLTPLMLACFRGHTPAVTHLLQAGADMDVQQHHSGKTALFYAVSGYKRSRISTREVFVAIIKLLIENGADITIQDRQENLFLHNVLLEWSSAHFLDVLQHSKKYKFINSDIRVFEKITDVVNIFNEDLILTAIKNKKMSHLEHILGLFPRYCERVFVNKKENDFNVPPAMMLNIITDYNEDELITLKKILRHHNTAKGYFTKLDTLRSSDKMLINSEDIILAQVVSDTTEKTEMIGVIRDDSSSQINEPIKHSSVNRGTVKNTRLLRDIVGDISEEGTSIECEPQPKRNFDSNSPTFFSNHQLRTRQSIANSLTGHNAEFAVNTIPYFNFFPSTESPSSHDSFSNIWNPK